MASALFSKFKEALLGADVDLAAVNIKCCLIDEADWTVDTATDEYLSDITAAAIVATSGNVGSKTLTGGVFDCSDPSFSAATGDGIEAAVYYVDTGVAATSLLICYVDGLTFTLDGSDVVMVNHASGVFAL
jgi:hypothetical protein